MSTRSQAKMNRIYLISLGVVLLLGGIVGYLIAPSPSNEGVNLGASNPSSTVISYYSALNKQVLWDALNTMMIDITRTHAVVGSMAVGSASWAPGTISSSSYVTASTTITATGAALGDIVLVSSDSATSTEAAAFSGRVTSANNVQIFPSRVNTPGAVTFTTSTFYVRVLDATTFTTPSAIRTSTSTSF